MTYWDTPLAPLHHGGTAGGERGVLPGPSFLVFEEHVPDATAGARVHPAGGLVEDHGPRRLEEGDAEGQLPPRAP